MTNIELKVALKGLEARVADLEKRDAERRMSESVVVSEKRTMCPHCKEVPAYHFHVKNCKANKNKNDGREEKP